jgi:hypothetical protein
MFPLFTKASYIGVFLTFLNSCPSHDSLTLLFSNLLSTYFRLFFKMNCLSKCPTKEPTREMMVQQAMTNQTCLGV